LNTIQPGSGELFLGDSHVMREFRARLALLAATDAGVLIHGESGSGKASAAAAIHAASARRAAPLVTVSLAALAPTLIEAELFGHEAGAFTGAHGSRLGRFRLAQGGSLVLDDVDALPLELQGKLLRVLQERQVEPLGSEVAHAIDVRLMCTTARDLREAVDSGTFRADLYWRVAVVPLEVPPLRARPDDIAPLAEQLIARTCERLKLVPRPLDASALALLRAHTWPGNVRELENALERVLVLRAQGVTREHTPPPIGARELSFLESTTVGAASELAERALARGLKLDDLERALLEAALREQRGNVTAAARQVGLTRRAFEYRMEHFQGQKLPSGARPDDLREERRA
jgi:DNA-binding NtrC family response regulator